jgi:hypothetical protein
MTYVYYVVYSHSHGWGSSEVHQTAAIQSIQDVMAISELLGREGNLGPVVITNFQLLRTEG